MKVLHVISSISRQGGGPSRSSQGLVGALHNAGVDVWLMTLAHGEEPWIKGCEQFINGGAFGDALTKIKPDIVHLHGIWQKELHRCAVICRRWHVPYVIAPRGMLEPWSLKTKWLKKRIARFLYQDRDLHQAAALHATAESEAAQFRKLSFNNPVIISPNGVNLPKSTPTPKTYTSDEKRRALFVSRMHPKKGVLELVESWARVKPTNWQCELVYTLNGDTEREYEAKVKQRILDLGMTYNAPNGTDSTDSSLAVGSRSEAGVGNPNRSKSACAKGTCVPNFILTGPLNDDEKWKAYARADLFVLPTYSENFGIVVAEALWAGVPVITTKGTPWQELETHHCGWWIDLPEKKVGRESRSTVDWPALDAALQEATSTSTSNLNLFGQNGHVLVETKYTWPAIAQTMIAGYKEVLHVS